MKFSINAVFFYAPEIEDQGAYCFCPVCHSDLLSETFNLLITIEQWVLDFRYFTWVFLLWYLSVGSIIFYHVTFYKTRPFHGYHQFRPCDLDLGVWSIFENFNFAYNYWTVSAKPLIFHINIPSGISFRS